MKKDDKNLYSDDLYLAILKLESIEEARSFFRDLLTEQEIVEFGKRWKAARMLDQKSSYVEIEQETGLSSATIARISKWLSHGMDGYKLMLRKTKEHHCAGSFIKNNRV